MSTARRKLMSVPLGRSGVVGCAGPPSPSPPGPSSASSGGRLCPLPLLFPEPQLRPRRVRIENRTADTLFVWIDRCWRHSRVAIVPPGRARQPELPRPLPDYPGGLRFFAYAPGRDERVGTWVVPAEPVPILRLDITEGSGVDRSSLRRFRLPQHEDRTVGSFRLGGTERGGYATLLSDPGAAVLTLSCVDGRPGLTVTVPRRFEGASVGVRARSPASEWVGLGRWPRRPGPRDLLRAPEGVLERAVRVLSHEGAVELELTGDGPPARLRFEPRGLAEVLAALGCRGSTLPG